MPNLTDRPNCYKNKSDSELFNRLEELLRDPDTDLSLIMAAARITSNDEREDNLE